MPGTFVSAPGGTFETVMPGTFHSATGGTFETVMGGTIKPMPSIAEAKRVFILPLIVSVEFHLFFDNITQMIPAVSH